MKANRAKNTSPERRLRKVLSSSGLGGYKLHYKGAPGRPDICYPRKKVAIFVHGCFWHRCQECRLPLPKSNKIYWKEKFRRNKLRDARKRRELQKAGWKSIPISKDNYGFMGVNVRLEYPQNLTFGQYTYTGELSVNFTAKDGKTFSSKTDVFLS